MSRTQWPVKWVPSVEMGPRGPSFDPVGRVRVSHGALQKAREIPAFRLRIGWASDVSLCETAIGGLGLRGRAFVAALTLCVGLFAATGNAMGGTWALGFRAFWPREGSSPQVAMAPDGEAAVVYRYGRTIRAWRHTPEAGWTGDEPFGDLVFPEESTCCLSVEAPAVAIDPSGDIAVVWQKELGGTGGTGIYASFWPRGGTFSAPTLIADGTSPDVAIDASGGVIVSWLFDDGTSTVVESATARIGGPFSPPTRLSGDGRDATDDHVSVNPEGEAVVSWIRPVGTSSDLEVAVRRTGQFPAPDGKGDGAELGVAQPTEPSKPPLEHVVLDSAGEGLAVWEAPGGAVLAARLPSGQSSFGPATTLGATGAFPWVAMDEAGEAVADWPIPGGIDVVTAGPGGSFGVPEQVTTEGTPDLAKVSTAPDGAVTLVWLENIPDGRNGPGCTEISESGSVRPPGETFARAATIYTACGGTGSATSLQIAGDANGDTLAIWDESTFIGEEVQGLVYDAGPSLSAVTIPTSGRVGQPVTFGMAPPVSLWRALSGVTWQFGDGAKANGLSVTHTYTQPGEYHVTASAADEQLFQSWPPEQHVENSVSGTIVVTSSPTIETGIPLARLLIAQPHQSHRTWRERVRRTHRNGPPVGTTFTFVLSQPASVRLTFSRLPGRCTSHHNTRHDHTCPRPATAGSLSLAGHAGRNTVHFQGRLSRSRWLAPGGYSLTITAANGVGRSTATALVFTIVA